MNFHGTHAVVCFPKTELWLKHFIYFRVLIYVRLSSLSYIMDMLNRTKRHVQNRDMPEAQSGRLIIMLHELRVPVVYTRVDCDCYSAERPYRQSLWLGISFCPLLLILSCVSRLQSTSTLHSINN